MSKRSPAVSKGSPAAPMEVEFSVETEDGEIAMFVADSALNIEFIDHAIEEVVPLELLPKFRINIDDLVQMHSSFS
ncbi:hypothetical protein OPV22_029482 [Ensete ventricosum]|uniref:SKP1 component POZ domain-containing protein n=1 Tax=Ensete ventricosum TaxID=4639 RepID=A0AAV8Q5W9_ENSVE|nr:hypothetical protein OPV22_029482 [Ensete ventricosum]